MPALSVPLSVRARRALVRPAVRRTVVAALALVTAVAVATALAAAGSARDRWGTARRVVVATRDLSPGDVVDGGAVEVRDVPAAVVVPSALAEPPLGSVVRQPILAGEAVAALRLAPDGLTGVAALVPAGQRAVAVPAVPGGMPPVTVGDLVDVVAVVAGAGDGAGEGGGEPAFTLVDGATVVDVDDQAVSVAVPRRDAPRVAWAVAHGAVHLALSGE